MVETYWDSTHSEVYSKRDWANKPSLFLRYALSHFPNTGDVLDIGTGQGQDAIFLQSLGHFVTATDNSRVALRNAKDKNQEVVFVQADTSKGLPFEDNAFDVVYSHMALHYFDEETTRRVFEDIYRTLRPFGLFATITNAEDDPECQSEGYTKLASYFYETPNGSCKRYSSIEDMKKMTRGLFEPILLDNRGETYKDEIKSLIRFIGKKISHEHAIQT